MYKWTCIKQGQYPSFLPPWKTVHTHLELAVSLFQHHRIPYLVLCILTFKYLPMSTALFFLSPSCLNPVLPNTPSSLKSPWELSFFTVCSQHMCCYGDKLHYSFYVCIVLAASPSSQTGCELRSYGFYIYFVYFQTCGALLIFWIILKSLHNFG